MVFSGLGRMHTARTQSQIPNLRGMFKMPLKIKFVGEEGVSGARACAASYA